jgi:hypothetical protein
MKKYSNVFGNTNSSLQHLEQPHPEQPVVPEEAGDVDRHRVGPVPVDGEEHDGEVEDVEGFVVVLVAVEVEVGELLEDRLKRSTLFATNCRPSLSDLELTMSTSWCSPRP